MAIVSSQVVARWGTWVKEEHVSSDGAVYTITHHSPVGDAADAMLAQNAIDLAAKLAQEEIDQELGNG